MKLAALFSGGKDSTYSIYKVKQMGHDVRCLITLFPKSANSHMLHFPNIKLTKLQSETLEIPQIDIDVVYKTAILDVNDPGLVLPIKPDPALSSNVYSDGTYVAIDPDHLLLEILEENTEYNKTNFEVEVFEVENEDYVSAKAGLSGTEVRQQELKPLFFKKPVENIVNNILVDDAELPKPPAIGDNPRMVNYYFNVFVDEEIDPADICEAKEELDKKNLFVDLDVVCAPNAATPTRYDVCTGPDPLAPCPVPQEGTDCND